MSATTLHCLSCGAPMPGAVNVGEITPARAFASQPCTSCQNPQIPDTECVDWPTEFETRRDPLVPKAEALAAAQQGLLSLAAQLEKDAGDGHDLVHAAAALVGLAAECYEPIELNPGDPL